MMIKGAEFWKMLARRPVASSIVAAGDEGEPVGFLALSFSHVSSEPPAISISVSEKTSALSVLKQGGRFSVNFLCMDQSNLSEVFGGFQGARRGERFDAALWERDVGGLVYLKKSPLILSCSVDRYFEYRGSVTFFALVEWYKVDYDREVSLYRMGNVK